MRHKWEFGPPEDTRKKACEACGLMDASVKARAETGKKILCGDCALELYGEEACFS